VALILGEDELASGAVVVKPLAGEAEQFSVAVEAVPDRVVELVRGG
jgi:histidyl-tRNA synthetase